MGIYICFGGCIILSALWILSVLMVKWIGSPILSCFFDFVLTIMVFALFAAGLYLNREQPNTSKTDLSIIQEELRESSEIDERTISSIQELASPAQEVTSDSTRVLP